MRALRGFAQPVLVVGGLAVTLLLHPSLGVASSIIARRTAPATASVGPPTVSLEASAASVRPGEPFTLMIRGGSAVGLAAVWWFGSRTGANGTVQVELPSEPTSKYGFSAPFTNPTPLDRAFGSPRFTAAQRVTAYQFRATLTIAAPGTYTFKANARDVLYPRLGEAHQASEGAGMPAVIVKVEEAPPEPAPLPDPERSSVEEAGGALDISANFWLNANPDSPVTSLPQGGIAHLAIAATLAWGAPTEPVTFSAVSLPEGLVPSFSPASCRAPCETTMRIPTTGSTPEGYYVIMVTGVSGSLRRTIPVALAVSAAAGTLQAPTHLFALPLVKASPAIELFWLNPAAQETGLQLERSRSPQFADPTVIAALPAGTTTHIDTGLLPDAEYYYRARVLVGGVASAYSNIAPARAITPPPADGYLVRPVYFLAKDMSVPPDHEAKLQTVMRLVQHYNALNLHRHGLGYRPFNMDVRPDGKPAITLVVGAQQRAYYDQLNRAIVNGASGPIAQEVRARFDPEHSALMIVSPLTGWIGYRPFGHHGTAWTGELLDILAPTVPGQMELFCAAAPYPGPGAEGRSTAQVASIRVGGLAHELGHGFGLSHIDSLAGFMGVGFHWFSALFNDCYDAVPPPEPVFFRDEALLLNNSVYFRAPTAYSDPRPPTITVAGPLSVSPGSNIPITVTVADAEGTLELASIEWQGKTIYTEDLRGRSSPVQFTYLIPADDGGYPPGPLPVGSHHVNVQAFDGASNRGSFTFVVRVANPPSGLLAPQRSNGSPTGILRVGTREAVLRLTTDIPATCKYSTEPGVGYAGMPLLFTTTGDVSHATAVTGLQDGEAYAYYVRCRREGAVSSVNETDYPITFSVWFAAPSLTFTAEPASIPAGQSSTLRWSSTNATSCVSALGNPRPLEGSVQVTPERTSIYSLTCIGPAGSVTRSATVTVLTAGAPTLTFTAQPPSILAGQSSTLYWSALNATGCVSASGVQRPVDGQAAVRPLTTTTYGLTCTGSGGSVTKTVTVTVQPAPAPLPTLTFTAQPPSILAGQSSTLRWSSTNATSCTSSGGSTKPLSGSALVRPQATTLYSLTCTGAGGAVIRSVLVTVNPTLPQ